MAAMAAIRYVGKAHSYEPSQVLIEIPGAAEGCQRGRQKFAAHARTHRNFRKCRVRIQSINVKGAKKLAAALCKLGVRVVNGSADLTVTLVNDYFEGQLEKLNRKHLSDHTPWLLVLHPAGSDAPDKPAAHHTGVRVEHTSEIDAAWEYVNAHQDEYGLYFKVARAFVRIIGRPELMRVLVGTGMHSRTLMEWVLRIMANLLRPDEIGPAEAVYKAVALLARAA